MTTLLALGMACATIIALGVWAWAPDRPRDQLETKYWDSATRYMEIGGASLRVRITGPKQAPAVILLHGFGSSLETWEAWAQAAFPERISKLILISPDGFASPGFEYEKVPQIPSMLKWMKFFLPRALLRTNLTAAYADPSRLHDATVDRYYDMLLTPGNRDAMIQRMRQTVLTDPVPLLGRIMAPTLILWGQQDRLIPFSNSADYLRAISASRLHSFADLGHVPHEEAPEQSLPVLAQFLSR